MAHRSGQNGCIVTKNGYRVVRFRQDIEGQIKRKQPAVRICPATGPLRLNISQQKFRAKQIIQESGADDLQKARKIAATNRAVTFGDQAEQWLRDLQNRKRDPVKPRTLENFKSHLRWLEPRVGDIPLSDLNPAQAKILITKMAEAGLGAKTIICYFGVFRSVIASARDDQGVELYPYKWNPEFLDLPKVNREEQNRPIFTAEQIEEIISQANDPQEAMFYALEAGTGLRIGEISALRVEHFFDDALHVKQALWNGKVFIPKTAAGKRVIDLPSELSFALRHFIGNRVSGFIFRQPSSSDKPLHVSDLLRRNHHPILKKLGIEKQGFHGFRRFRVTHLRKQRVPEDLIRLWIGHSNRSVTDGYVKLSDDEAFRKTWAEKAGLGFQLKSLHLFSSVLLDTGLQTPLQVHVV